MQVGHERVGVEPLVREEIEREGRCGCHRASMVGAPDRKLHLLLAIVDVVQGLEVFNGQRHATKPPSACRGDGCIAGMGVPEPMSGEHDSIPHIPPRAHGARHGRRGARTVIVQAFGPSE